MATRGPGRARGRGPGGEGRGGGGGGGVGQPQQRPLSGRAPPLPARGGDGPPGRGRRPVPPPPQLGPSAEELETPKSDFNLDSLASALLSLASEVSSEGLGTEPLLPGPPSDAGAVEPEESASSKLASVAPAVPLPTTRPASHAHAHAHSHSHSAPPPPRKLVSSQSAPSISRQAIGGEVGAPPVSPLQLGPPAGGRGGSEPPGRRGRAPPPVAARGEPPMLRRSNTGVTASQPPPGRPYSAPAPGATGLASVQGVAASPPPLNPLVAKPSGPGATGSMVGKTPPEPPPKPRKFTNAVDADSSSRDEPVPAIAVAPGAPVPPPKPPSKRNSGGHEAAPAASSAPASPAAAVSSSVVDSPSSSAKSVKQQPPPLKESLLRALNDPRVDLPPELDDSRYPTKRDLIAKEIMTSEQSYVKSMHILVKGWLEPLREISAGKDPFVTRDQVEGIFQHVETILSVNRELYTKLKQRVVEWTPTVKVGDIFLEYLPMLKLYSAYTSAYERAVLLVDSLDKSHEFLKFCVFRKERPEFGGHDLRSYLIMPVQRIPRYNLLLKDLLKNTPEEHPDRTNLEKAITDMRQVADTVNIAIREHEERLKVINIQNNLEGKIELVAPHRRFIREGSLMKICRKKAKPRYVFLFNDVICYCSEVPASKKLQMHRMLKLQQASLVDLPDSDMLQHGFQFVNPEKSFTLLAATQEEKYEWLREIQSCVDVLAAQHPNKNGGKATLAPVWMPDHMQVICSVCKLPFSKVKRRRHHCRSCGCLCCGECSKKRFELPNLGLQSAQRVCDPCYSKLDDAKEVARKEAVAARKERLYAHRGPAPASPASPASSPASPNPASAPPPGAVPGIVSAPAPPGAPPLAPPPASSSLLPSATELPVLGGPTPPPPPPPLHQSMLATAQAENAAAAAALGQGAATS